MQHIELTLSRVAEGIAIAKAFLDKFSQDAPAGFPATLAFDYKGKPHVSLCMPSTDDKWSEETEDNRQKLLAAAGDLFGRQGWTRDLNYDKTGYDWLQTIDGVAVKIANAERREDPRTGTPVPPTLFPVLLMDRQPEAMEHEPEERPAARPHASAGECF